MSRIRILVLSLIVVFSQINPLWANASLLDIKGHWAEGVIIELYHKDIVSGDVYGRFKPEKYITRAEFTSMIVKALSTNKQLDLQTDRTVNFSDLPLNHWAYNSVQVAYNNSIISGVSDDMFMPDLPLTREQAAVILARAVYPNITSQNINSDVLKFKDRAQISAWAKTGVALAVHRGIVGGVPGNKFKPRECTTKAEAACMILNMLNPSANQHVTILMYHHIAPPGTYEKFNGATITTTAFEQQMQALVEFGYTSITTKQLYDFLENGTPLPNKPVLITFDDGYESNYIYAYPVMRKYGIKGVINIVVSATPNYNQSDNNNRFDPKNLTHLTWRQMREMVDSGLIEIQSHTYDNHEMPLTEKKWLAAQKRAETKAEYKERITQDLQKAKSIIKTNLNTEVTVLCYPFGRYSDTTEVIAKSLGYKMTFTTKDGYVVEQSSPYLLKRKKVGPKDTLADFLLKL